MTAYQDFLNALANPIYGISFLNAGDIALPVSAPGTPLVPLQSRAKVLGAGSGLTVFRVPAAADRHVFEAVNAHDIHLEGFTIDCRGDTFSSASWHGLRFAGNCRRIRLKDISILAPSRYGAGFQSGTFVDIRIEDCEIIDPGGDGVDFKNDSALNENISVDGLWVTNPGVRIATQVGLDIRGQAILNRIFVDQVKAGHRGIRTRGTSLGGHNTTLSCFDVQGEADAAMGVEVGGDDCRISSGMVRGCVWGMIVGGQRCTVDTFTARDCTGDGIQVAAIAAHAQLHGIQAHNCTDDGVEMLGIDGILDGYTGSGNGKDLDIKGSGNRVSAMRHTPSGIVVGAGNFVL